VSALFNLPAGFNEWRLALGATSHLGRLGVAFLFVAAGLAIVVSMLSLAEERRGRGAVLLALRVLGVLACLLTALQPTIELRQVTRLPNRVAVLVDASRSMEVRPPDGGPSRAERAAAMLERAAPRLAAWQQAGHEVDIYSFGENVSPATAQSLREPPGADATRIGEALGDVRARYAGRDLGAVVVISDGIDTGRIGEGPLDVATRTAIEALGAPVHTVGLGEKSLRDLSVAAVLADQFAFVRTPASIEAVIRQSGLPDRQVEVTLERDGRPVASRSVVLRGDRSEEKIAFDWLPDHPGNFVFRISTPVLAGEALKINNEQSFALKVIRDRVRVLHLSGRPSWDERFLRSMLRRDPNVDLVSFFILRHRERRAALEPQRPVADPVSDLRDLRGAAALVRSGDLPELQLRPVRRRAVPVERARLRRGRRRAGDGGRRSVVHQRRVRRHRASPGAAGRAAAHGAHGDRRGRRRSDHRRVPAQADRGGADAPCHLAAAGSARQRAALGPAAGAGRHQPRAPLARRRDRRC
jgi:hypothetical protein